MGRDRSVLLRRSRHIYHGDCLGEYSTLGRVELVVSRPADDIGQHPLATWRRSRVPVGRHDGVRSSWTGSWYQDRRRASQVVDGADGWSFLNWRTLPVVMRAALLTLRLCRTASPQPSGTAFGSGPRWRAGPALERTRREVGEAGVRLSLTEDRLAYPGRQQNRSRARPNAEFEQLVSTSGRSPPAGQALEGTRSWVARHQVADEPGWRAIGIEAEGRASSPTGSRRRAYPRGHPQQRTDAEGEGVGHWPTRGPRPHLGRHRQATGRPERQPGLARFAPRLARVWCWPGMAMGGRGPATR